MATKKPAVHFILNGRTACGDVGPKVQAATHQMDLTTCVICRVTRPFIDAERRRYAIHERRRHLEHLLLCHGEGEPCKDGCDWPALRRDFPAPPHAHGRWAIAECVSCSSPFLYESVPDVENGPGIYDDEAPDLCDECAHDEDAPESMVWDGQHPDSRS